MRRHRPAPPPDPADLEVWLSKLGSAYDDAGKRAAPVGIREPLGAAKTFLTAVIAAGAQARDQFGPMAYEQAITNARQSLSQYQEWHPPT